LEAATLLRKRNSSLLPKLHCIINNIVTARKYNEDLRYTEAINSKFLEWLRNVLYFGEEKLLNFLEKSRL